MHVVIFGLSVSSSWGNGHATLWRSLIKSMLRRGHTVNFYEREVPYYAGTRDLYELPKGGRLLLYEALHEILPQVKRDLDSADLAVCTSFCPDGKVASSLILESRAAVKAFYDLDTPVTLEELQTAGSVRYLPDEGLGRFDVVLSFTGGRALDALKSRLGARNVFPLYGSVDPEHHFPVAAEEKLRSTLSYLGTYAADRQDALERLFVDSARHLPEQQFLIGGAQYPDSFQWLPNVAYTRHMPPAMHSAFFSSSRTTLNATRGTMARYGYCPSGRMFEATACGVPLLTDTWEGLDSFFTPGTQVLPVASTGDVLAALSLTDRELQHVAQAGRDRTLQEHTGICRVIELEEICSSVLHGASPGTAAASIQPSYS